MGTQERQAGKVGSVLGSSGGQPTWCCPLNLIRNECPWLTFQILLADPAVRLRHGPGFLVFCRTEPKSGVAHPLSCSVTFSHAKCGRPEMVM